MKWLEIGDIKIGDNKRVTINLHSGYEPALKGLDEFSHCMIYILLEDRIDVVTARIIEVKGDNGKVLVELVGHDGIGTSGLKGQLIDIKPYFPVEEVMPNSIEGEDRFCINYTGDIIGKYTMLGERQVILIDNEALGCIGLENGLSKINEGDYLRVLWWFDRFDKDSFRKTRTCKPPYNNAPRTGIFATRSPVRPNPLASTIVRVAKVDKSNGVIDAIGFDGFSESMIFQIMHYQSSKDMVREATVPKWVSHWTNHKTFDKNKEIDISDKARDKISIDSDVYCTELDEDISDDDNSIDEIGINNAHINNLKGISLALAKNKIHLITGVSGSGKSSLAFDTIYAESKRRFADLVLSNDLGGSNLSNTMVDKITGLMPAIAIEQRLLGSNPRSTVGTVTKIADIIKLIFTTIGERLCPICHETVDDTNVCNNCGQVLFDKTPQMFSYNNPDYMCPVCRGLGIESTVDINKIVEHPELSLLDSASKLYGNLRKHSLKPNANWMRGEVLALALDMRIDLNRPFTELPESFKEQFFYGSDGREVSLQYTNSRGRSGTITRPVEGAVNLIHRLMKEGKSSIAIGHTQRFLAKQVCTSCQGERLREEARLVNIKGYRYPEVMRLSIDQLIGWCHSIYSSIDTEDKEKTKGLFIKLNHRLTRIQHVGLGYINPNRDIPSLSGGEAQRIKLATQFGTGLRDILYIMDEPSKGLHPRDYRFIMDSITELKKQGNTIILVEHKRDFLSIADSHILMGPRAGKYGGEIVSIENMETVDSSLCTIGEDHTSIDMIGLSTIKPPIRIEQIHMSGVSTNNLKQVNVSLPMGLMTAVVGVSGSGKSSLISKTLYPYLIKSLDREIEDSSMFDSITIEGTLKDVAYVNQSPVGNNRRSNPGTYTGVFDLIRNCYARIQDAKGSGLTKDYFSFNSKSGQCPECLGLGVKTIEMHYMDDIYTPCDRCNGKRYRDKVLGIKRKGLSIGDILDMEINELLEVFKEEEEIVSRLSTLTKIGLGYLRLGQSTSTLSGGESQRLKLAKELYKKDCKGILYILDEPTTGLHEQDVMKIISVLKDLKSKGATVIVIEHNEEIIRSCDYLVELGPKGGIYGGDIIRSGFVDNYVPQMI